MTKAKDEVRRSSCSECPNSFELIPPADREYTVPREKPKSEDYIKRIYECNGEGHRNTIYWEKEEFFVVSGKIGANESPPYKSTRYGHDVGLHGVGVDGDSS
jgi:hypothetical protein